MAGLNQQPEFASRYDHFNPGLKGRNRSNTGTANITMPHNDRPCHGEARELWRGGGGGGNRCSEATVQKTRGIQHLRQRPMQTMAEEVSGLALGKKTNKLLPSTSCHSPGLKCDCHIIAVHVQFYGQQIG